MDTAIQLTITHPNRPGALATISDKLRSSDVNINAISITEGPTHSLLHLIVDDPETAVLVLKSQYKVATTDVLAFKMKNKLGVIASIARACAASNINIRNMYATTAGKEATIFVLVDDIAKARKLLESWKKSFGKISA